MKKLSAVLLTSILLILINPSLSWACSTCTLQASVDMFPFLPVWIALYVFWFIIYLAWSPPWMKTKKMVIGFGLFMVIMACTFLLPIIFIWAAYVIKNIWRAVMTKDVPPNFNRRTELYLNGSCAVIMLISIPVMNWHNNQTDKLISRLGYNETSPSLQAKLIAKGPEAIPHLRKALEDGINHYTDSPDIRKSPIAANNAAKILGKMRDTESIDLLIKGLLLNLKESHNEPWDIQYGCAEALKNIGGDQVIEKLIKSLDLAEGKTSERILDSLKKITGQDIGDNAQEWGKWWAKTPKKRQ
jgi:hypothetical protein